MINDKKYFSLNSGVKMPVVGLGTWKSSKDKAGAAVEYAIMEYGYRHIDCASIYGNEPEIGVALQKVFSGGKVKREDVFVTSKLWDTAHATKDVLTACKKTLADLQLDYLDLYLMHWGYAEWSVEEAKIYGQKMVDEKGVLNMPKVSIRETWEAMEELVRAGLVKAIGVSNFTGPMLIDLLTYAKIKPAVNQIELHPYCQQARLVEFCLNQDVVVTAYSPLGAFGDVKDRPGEPIILEDQVIIDLARGHQKTPAQILLRWGIQRGTIVIPKSITPENIKNNIEIFDFELSKVEMDLFGTLERRHRFTDPWDWRPIPYFD